MNKQERYLLLFLETCVVDNYGAVNTVHMNEQDMKTVEAWNYLGYIQFGRIHSSLLPLPSGSTHYCKLSASAWVDAHQERIARAKRNRNYADITLEAKNAA